MTAIVGREADLEAGERFLSALASGPARLSFEGEAGIGKTTVWATIARRAEARGMLVLSARPARPESALSLATLADLLDPIDAATFHALPAPQEAAIEAVLLGGRAGDRPVQPRLLGIAVRTALEGLARAQPVVLAIDDLQWADRESASVLGFALRRLGTSRVGLLAARRTGEPVPEGMAGLLDGQTVTVGPMSVAGLHHVVRQELGDAPSRPTMVRVHAAAGGNPLFALEIVRLLRETGEPTASQPLPVPGDVRELIGERIRRLTPSVRECLLVASAVAQPDVDLVRRVLDRDVGADLEVAEDRRLIEVDRGRIAFRHPLFRAAIYGQAPAPDRRAMHRRAAMALAGSEEGARHGALAADAPDADVAEALEAAATDAIRRGAPAAAADLLELSIQLTPANAIEDRERRSIVRGEEMARGGDTAQAISILEELVGESASPTTRVRARLKLAAIRYDLDPEPAKVFALCEAALAEPFDDIELRALAHATYAAASWVDENRLKTHANEAMRLLDLLPDPDPATVGLAIMAKVEADVDSRNPVPDPQLVKRALEAEARDARPSVAERFSGALGVYLKYADDFEGARPWLEGTLRTAEEEGDEAGIPYALSHLPQLELWTGHWSKAEEYARRHLDVAVDTGLEFQRETAMYNLAIVHVHQGRVDEARGEIEPNLARAADEGNKGTEYLLLATRCLLELSLGNLEAAVRDGRRASEVRDSIRSDTGGRRHEPDVVEALVGLGDLEGASRLLARVEEAAASGRLPTHAALAHRARATFEAARGDTDAALTSLDAAFAQHGRALNPFDRARTRLVLGQVRRRRRERRLAREALEAALAEFRQLGSPLWAAKAQEELDRLGIRHGAADGSLTEMERRAAELAARGLTNKEVAGKLGVSPKTVEAHLARAYEKLGIASRAELGARLAQRTEAS